MEVSSEKYIMGNLSLKSMLNILSIWYINFASGSESMHIVINKKMTYNEL